MVMIDLKFLITIIKDFYDIKFRNNFDNIFTFHNCSEHTIDKLKKYDFFNEIKNKEFIIYNNINYTESLKKTIYHLKENGYTHIIYCEDDSLFQFGLNDTNDRHIILDDLINFIKENDKFGMINLEWNGGWEGFYSRRMDNEIKNYKYNNLNIFETKSIDWSTDSTLYAFDGGAYVAKIDYLIDNLYDDGYFSQGDSWSGERYLNNKWKQKEYERLTTNLPIYKRYNILGKNSWNRNEELKTLKNLFT